MSDQSNDQTHIDWWSRRFGNRGVLQVLIGADTEAHILLLLNGAFVYVILFKDSDTVTKSLVWLLPFTIALYFTRNIVTAIISLVEAIRGNRKNPIV
jgi:hypothetical protein